MSIFFDEVFCDLTGHSPFHWQRRLCEQLVESPATEWPTVVDIPTGLGKTHVITIWYCAWLATKRNRTSEHFPRRLVYVVNRRTVVDQSTDVVQQLLKRLEEMGYEKPAVSTLRGELADNGEWKRDLSKPAVIIGTVDMIGSKLLFSGYGDSHRTRPLHAGIIGQDALIVHDEAHLTRPFGKLLRQISKRQIEDGEARAVRVMELSATADDDEEGASRVFRLDLENEPDDEQKAEAKRRVTAVKYLRLHVLEQATKAKVVDRLFELAQSHADSGERVLLFVQSPEDVMKLQIELGEVVPDERVAVLTGTMRGKERDELMDKQKRDPEIEGKGIFRWFLGRTEPGDDQSTAYLISTSAGEVGVDFNADHIVCDLTTLDGMIQRLGRVNRRGGRPIDSPSWVDVVISYSKDKKRAKQLEATVEALTRLPRLAGENEGHQTYDASPHALTELLVSLTSEEKEAAWLSHPDIPTLTDILLDAWSLTSLSRSGKDDYPPPVAPWLHGIEDDLPQTHVAWRWDLADIKAAEQRNDTSVLNNVMSRFQLLSHEQLRDRTDRVKRNLQEIVKRLERETQKDADTPPPDQCFAAVQVGSGDWQWKSLRVLADDVSLLAHATIVLPVEVGGFEKGLLNGKQKPPDNPRSLDVAETSREANADGVVRQRREITDMEDQAGAIADQMKETGLRRVLRITLKNSEETEDENGRYLDYFVSRQDPGAVSMDDGELGEIGQPLNDHKKAVVDHARRLAKVLQLDPTIAEALSLAACWHDDGKAIPLWQRYACNASLDNPVAKSIKYRHWRALGGYRHEFGSLLKASGHETIKTHPEQDLILHLIAAHHGRARPHFFPEAGHLELGEIAHQEDQLHKTMRRFARLQHRFGRWHLAWLESLLRCADALGSQPNAADVSGYEGASK